MVSASASLPLTFFLFNFTGRLVNRKRLSAEFSPSSSWESRDDLLFLNLWTPVCVGAGNTALQERCTDHRRVPKTIIFLNIPGIYFLAKCNARFIEKSSSVSNKRQVGPPGPYPWIRHWITNVLLPGHFALIQFKYPWIKDFLFTAHKISKLYKTIPLKKSNLKTTEFLIQNL